MKGRDTITVTDPTRVCSFTSVFHAVDASHVSCYVNMLRPAGTIPPELAQLKNLQQLHLHSNKLSGKCCTQGQETHAR